MSKQMLKESSVSMALMDAMPVCFFAIHTFLLSTLFPSLLFRVGALLCVLAGFGKVLWKLILAISKKSVDLLNKQMRYVMPAGFFLILLSLVVDRRYVNWSKIGSLVFSFPAVLFFGLGLIGMGLMGVCAKKLDPAKKSSNWIEQSINLLAQFMFLLGVVLCWTAAGGSL